MSEPHVFKPRAECPFCGAIYDAPFGDVFFVAVDCCVRCGQPKGHDWIVRNMRWVSRGRLFKPSTWGTGHWETPE